MRSYRPILTLLLVTGVASCSGFRNPTREIVPVSEPATLDSRSPYLKAHMRDGSVYILNNWALDSTGTGVAGAGVLQDASRTPIETGEFMLVLDSVALFETNVDQLHPSIAAIGLLSGVSAALTLYCLSDTKNCFGSCPTFYVAGENGDFLAAEGFSASIAPSLEATDVDALVGARHDGRTIDLRMTNEALETHVVRHVRLLVAPRYGHEHVIRTADDAFFAADLVSATSCTAHEGSCEDVLARLDQVERFRGADSLDLATKETIDLAFEAPREGEALGLAIAARQSLLSSYLLYQTLAWLGNSAGQVLASLSRRADLSLDQAWRMRRALGGIEVLVWSEGAWVSVGEVHETGPLASDVHLVRLPESVTHDAGPIRVRLSLTKGHWRIDQVALASMGHPVTPVSLEPEQIMHEGQPDAEALGRLLDPGQVLVTMPGDVYTLTFRLPDTISDPALFLESRGYYLEWMRREWLAEEDLARARMMMLEPERALRELAPAYVAQEARMEEVFWGSRYVRR